MGLGGHLIWTRVFANISDREKKPITVCCMPLLSDILQGKMYNSEVSFCHDDIFQNNPRLEYTTIKKKNFIFKGIDYCFRFFLLIKPVKRIYELLIFNTAEFFSKNGYKHYIHIDMLIHSYAKKETRKKFEWKDGGNVATVILKRFSNDIAYDKPELYFSDRELSRANQLIKTFKLKKDFITIEPGTKTEWFGDLRAWEFEKWQDLVNSLSSSLGNNCPLILQIGLKETDLLDGVIDFRGLTNFRESSILISKSKLFIGTEGGLMHAASAVQTKSVIIWGGVTLPEFAGYPNHHSIICNYVPCSPCGLKGKCPNENICLSTIEVSDVKKLSIASLKNDTCS